MAELNFALIGCGRIAKRHAELLGHRQIANARLVAVCDTRQERAAAIGRQFAVPHYADMHEMMRKERVDVAVVLTESGLHADHVVSLAPFGAHIVVEKPMALTLRDADRMIAACDHANVKLFVVKQNRFNVPVVKLREALEAGRFGKLVLGTVRVRWCRPQSYYDQDDWRGTWAMDGGVLSNQASHHIDMLEWMMGEVDTVHAMSTTALVDIEAEDTAVVTLRFQNGALGVIEATQPGDEDVMQKYSVNPPNVYGFGHQAYYEHVVDCILNNRRHLVDGLEGRKSLELISAIYESIETGREVQLRFNPKRCKLGVRS
jgi:UDP-N-acetyl-2-amino-2-deoxyglucuronate dehydrogenase